MNIFYINPNNVINFVEKRLNFTEEGLGLYTPEITNNLKTGSYIPVLKAIWTEKDKTRRLEWLRSHASELHAPLMFEQALAEFENKPNVDTINLISIPLIRAATFRLTQDSKCSLDVSVFNGDAGRRMELTYINFLNSSVKTILNNNLEDILQKDQIARIAAIKQKVVAVAQASLTTQLPSPNWIGEHGMMKFSNGESIMHPPADFKTLRISFAKKHLKKLSSL